MSSPPCARHGPAVNAEASANIPGNVSSSAPVAHHQTEWQRIHNREEVRSVRRSAKKIRGLCKDYGVGFDSSFLSRGRGGGSSASSSGSSDDAGEHEVNADRKDPVSWAQMKEILDAVAINSRVENINDISNSLSNAASRAAMDLVELEGFEESQAEAEKAFDSHDVLLEFRVEKMPAIEALRRCAKLTPALEAETARRLKELQKLPVLPQKADDEQDADDVIGDDDVEDLRIGMRSEVAMKLEKLGHLPREADRDLRMVLEAQKQEIKLIAQRIDDEEKKVNLQQLALEYLDGSLDMKAVDGQMLDGAIRLAQDVKSRIFTTKRAEANRAFQQALVERNAPLEAEVQDCMEECQRLRGESDITDDRVLQMLSAVALENSHSQAARPSPSPGLDTFLMATSTTSRPASRTQRSASKTPRHSRPPSADQIEHGNDPTMTRRGAMKNDGASDSPMAVHPSSSGEVPQDDLPKVQAKLKKEVSQLEKSIKDADHRAESIEGLLRNAEQSVKILEETKTLFLEQLVRDKPSLLEPFGILSEDKQAREIGSSIEHSEEELDETEEAKRLQNLAAEEQFLRMELSIAESNFDEDSDSVFSKQISDQSYASIRPEDTVFKDVRRLALRVEQEVQRKIKERDRLLTNQQGDDDISVASDHPSSDDDAKGVERPLSPRAATEMLQSTAHPEMQELVELRETNAMLLGKIQEIQSGIHEARVVSGALNINLAGDASNLPAELTAEVQGKIRELQALRKRWWSERQDPQTTVRRALACQDLDIDSTQPDAPPHTAQASLFQRIQASMTMP